MIALAALVVAGEPAPKVDHAALLAAPVTSLELVCDDMPVQDAEAVEVAEQRSRTAMRLRWAVTLPHSSGPLSFGVMR